MATKKCPYCSEEIQADAVKCKHCGEWLDKTRTTEEKILVVRPAKSRTIAILLALFLGGAGMHKFYLGRPGWGLVYLLFCWTFIPAIIGFIEGVGYILMGDEKFAQTYKK